MSGTLPEYRRGHGEGLAHLADVVDAQDRGALGGGEDRGGDRAAEALAGGRAVDLADEALAGGTDHQRPAELAQLAETAQQLHVVGGGLAEADAGIEPYAVLGDAGRDGGFEPLGEERLDLGDNVVVAGILLHRPRLAEHVHEDDGGATLGAQPTHLRVTAQGGDVVDDLGAGIEGGCGDGGLGSVNADARFSTREALNYGDDPPQLLLRRNRLRPRPRRFPPDVENLSPGLRQLPTVRDCRMRIDVQPTI